MVKELKEKVLYKIAMLKKPKIDIDALKERLDVQKWVDEDFQFIPTQKPEKDEFDEIVIGLLHCEETSYNMIHSLYYSFEDDKRCRPVVILQGKGYKNQYKELRKQMKEHAMRYEYDFNCTDIKFDILIVHHIQLPPTGDIEKIINNTTLRAAVPVGVVNYDGKGIRLEHVKKYKATEVFVEQSIYDLTPAAVRGELHCYVTGNPKFDCIYHAWKRNVTVPESFAKLIRPEIKKIILWTTDHKGGFDACSPEVAFDLYADTVFNYVKEHEDVGVIFRPYRTYVYELLQHGLWNNEQVEYFKEYCRQSKNLVWDDEPDYSASYSIADAILADAGCGIICSALPMMKPIGVTLRYDMDVTDILSANQEICDNHYLISSKEDMLSFFDMVKNDMDPNYEKRKELCSRYVTNFDGKNGERIKNILMQELKKEDKVEEKSKMKKGIVYWITGLAGSGKTTIGNALYYKMKKTTAVVLLDGDVLKTIVGGEKPGYAIADRLARAKRYSLLCKMLSDQGINVIICTIAMFDEIREWNRENFAHYIEIFLDVPLEVLKRRNKKGLYTDTLNQGEVPGFHYSVEFPKNPDIVLNTDGTISVSECVKSIQNVSWKEKKEYNRDTDYWNAYYKQKSSSMDRASSFAHEMLNYINKHNTGGGYLLDLGCGNGRDSIFFAQNGIHVVGIDASDIAIEMLGRTYEHDRFLEFICDDFITADVLFQREYDCCYSRFTLHAINEKQEDQLLGNVYKALKKGGLFMIEARTIHDAIYGLGELVERNAYIYNDHYRRFIDLEELTSKIKDIGFKVVFCEEGKGFSKTATEDPTLLRLVAEK